MRFRTDGNSNQDSVFTLPPGRSLSSGRRLAVRWTGTRLRYARVTMMQTADLGDGRHPSPPRRLDDARERSVVIQSLPVLPAVSLGRHAVATAPAGSWEMVSFNSPTTAAFPEILPGRLPHLGLSRHAQRSRALRPAYSPSRQMRPVASKAPTISLPPSPLRLLPAGTTVAGRDSHSLKRHALARRTVFGPYASSNAPRKTEFSA